jgi:hypothetical protein
LIRHGASHGLAYLVCTIAAGLLVYLLGNAVPSVLRQLSAVSDLLIDRFAITAISRGEMNVIILAFILAIIWGMAFKRMHTD